MIVVDTSVVAAAALPAASTPDVLRALERDPAWIAPALWRIELRNVLATAMRVRGLDLERAAAAFATAEQLVLDARVEPTARESLELAARGGITAYDAEFVFVAERLDLPLVTADRRLARAFPARAVLLAEFASGR